jgi:hypothetical protein
LTGNGYRPAMTTEPDPKDVVPTDNSLGAPVDDNQLDELTHPAEGSPEAELEKTPGPAGGDPVIGGLDDA